MKAREDVMIRWDGFVRAALLRRVDDGAAPGCAWCGIARRVDARGRRLPLYRYSWQTDGARGFTGAFDRQPFGYTADRAFCGVGCFRAYFGA